MHIVEKLNNFFLNHYQLDIDDSKVIDYLKPEIENLININMVYDGWYYNH